MEINYHLWREINSNNAALLNFGTAQQLALHETVKGNLSGDCLIANLEWKVVRSVWKEFPSFLATATFIWKSLKPTFNGRCLSGLRENVRKPRIRFFRRNCKWDVSDLKIYLLDKPAEDFRFSFMSKELDFSGTRFSSCWRFNYKDPGHFLFPYWYIVYMSTCWILIKSTNVNVKFLKEETHRLKLLVSQNY